MHVNPFGGPSDWWNNGLVGLIILGLAVWRMSSMLVKEEGPWCIFCRLRRAAGVRYNEFSRPVGEGMLAKVLSCVWCTSIWIGAAAWLLLLLIPWLTMLLACPLALSALAIMVERLVGNE